MDALTPTFLLTRRRVVPPSVVTGFLVFSKYKSEYGVRHASDISRLWPLAKNYLGFAMSLKAQPKLEY